VTELLRAWSGGEPRAFDELVPLVYGELKQQAERYLRREKVGHSLQATALVHEAYLRLVDQRRIQWQGRTQFFGIAAQLMRRVLVDHARTRHAEKRGGANVSLVQPLDEATAAAVPAAALDVDLLALDDALTRLTALDERQAKVVELRYFSGLGIEETAEVLGISPATVKRDWTMARAWLKRELSNT
jgi:RNA polymerase sigma factor (TIGR02999 family)